MLKVEKVCMIWITFLMIRNFKIRRKKEGQTSLSNIIRNFLTNRGSKSESIWKK